MRKGKVRFSLVAAGFVWAVGASPVGAASHREAPLMTLDPAADISDVYAFVSYDAANLARPPAERRVTLVLNVVPGQEPGSGPNYFTFDDPRKPPKALLAGAREFVQVSRMGNPLVNELIIPFGRKDFWNATDAEDEAIFIDAYRNLAVAGALQLLAGPAVSVPPAPREDVVRLLLKYADQNPDPAVGPFVELLRLDMTVPPTPPGQIRRLGPFAHTADGSAGPDPAGFPNGRRPNDDVTDLVVRVAGGPDFFTFFVGDGVGINEKGITPDFPFLPTPFDGRNRRHRDPGEAS